MYQVTHHMALLWSAEIRRIAILLTLHSSGVKTLLRRNAFSKPVMERKNECYLLKELFRQS